MMNQQSIISLINEAIKLAENEQQDRAYRLFNTISHPLPDDINVQFAYGQLCHLLKEKALAINTFANLALEHPENSFFLSALGAAYIANREYRLGLHFSKKALAINPRDILALTNCGSSLYELGQTQGGVHSFEAALALSPRNPAIAHGLTTGYRELKQYDKAIKYAKVFIKLEPKNFFGYYQLGYSYLEQGDADAAIKAFQQAIKQDPAAGLAYFGIAESKKFTQDDTPLIKQMEQLLNVGMPASQKAYIHSALGKVYDDLRLQKTAFSHIKQANLLSKPAHQPPSPKSIFKQYRKIFTPKLLQDTHHQGSPSTRPVFIVGMPRSGSTLIEQIISSHPDAVGAGELGEIENITKIVTPSGTPPQNFPALWREYITTHPTQELAEPYLNLLTSINPNAAKIVDKQLANYFLLGIILLLFPNATIIHTLRNPLDCCLSIYFKPFRGVNFAYDLQLIGKEYRLYRQIMAHWKSILPPNRIVDVQYEDLIKAPEEQSRRLIAACGLEWDARCLQFYKKEGSVSTASLVQVRQPIYQTAQKRWLPYAEFLGELAMEIEAYLDKEEIEVFTKLGINVKKYALQHYLMNKFWL